MTDCAKSSDRKHGWDLKGGTDTASVEQCHWCGAYRIEDKYPTAHWSNANYSAVRLFLEEGPLHADQLWFLMETIFQRLKAQNK